MSSAAVQAAVGTDREYRSVAVNNNTTDVEESQCVAVGIRVTVALSANVVNVRDGNAGTIIASLPASSAVGTSLDLLNTKCQTGLSIEGAGTGTVVIVYKRC
jgi:hypothetical protein